jgi:uncharacterized membrane protein
MRALARFLSVCVSVVPLSAGTPAAAAGASFTPLGFLPGGVEPAFSLATDISADGRTIVGGSTYFAEEQARIVGAYWRDGSINALPQPPDLLPSSVANCVSADGSVIGGTIGFWLNGYEPRNGVYWSVTPQGTTTKAFDEAYAINDVTADGTVRVGATRVPGLLPVIDQGFFESDNGGIQTIGRLQGTGYSWLEATSADGSVAVGFADTPSNITSIRWTEEGGLEQLPNQPVGVASQASGITPDGSIITGYLGEDAYRWTQAGGFQLLGHLPGAGWAEGRDISADGSVIVGYNAIGGGDVAFIWDAAHGMRARKDALQSEFGLDLAGWELRNANAISDDGLSIVGWGTNPAGFTEAFVVRLPEPGAGLALLVLGVLAQPRRR